MAKYPTANTREARHGFDPQIGKIPWSRKWQPTQYSCLENSMDRGVWRATGHWVARADMTEYTGLQKEGRDIRVGEN